MELQHSPRPNIGSLQGAVKSVSKLQQHVNDLDPLMFYLDISFRRIFIINCEVRNHFWDIAVFVVPGSTFHFLNKRARKDCWLCQVITAIFAQRAVNPSIYVHSKSHYSWQCLNSGNNERGFTFCVPAAKKATSMVIGLPLACSYRPRIVHSCYITMALFSSYIMTAV